MCIRDSYCTVCRQGLETEEWNETVGNQYCLISKESKRWIKGEGEKRDEDTSDEEEVDKGRDAKKGRARSKFRE